MLWARCRHGSNSTSRWHGRSCLRCPTLMNQLSRIVPCFVCNSENRRTSRCVTHLEWQHGEIVADAALVSKVCGWILRPWPPFMLLSECRRVGHCTLATGSWLQAAERPFVAEDSPCMYRQTAMIIPNSFLMSFQKHSSHPARTTRTSPFPVPSQRATPATELD